jgi:hypothetical protein
MLLESFMVAGDEDGANRLLPHRGLARHCFMSPRTRVLTTPLAYLPRHHGEHARPPFLLAVTSSPWAPSRSLHQGEVVKAEPLASAPQPCTRARTREHDYSLVLFFFGTSTSRLQSLCLQYTENGPTILLIIICVGQAHR